MWGCPRLLTVDVRPASVNEAYVFASPPNRGILHKEENHEEASIGSIFYAGSFQRPGDANAGGRQYNVRH